MVFTSAVLFQVMPCSLGEVFQCFIEIGCLCHWGRCISLTQKRQGGPWQSPVWPVGGGLVISVQENKQGPMKELVLSGINQCVSDLRSRSISGLQQALHWVTIAILSVLFTCFTFFEASNFCTKGKITLHFEANSQSFIAGQFPEPL